ncbi:hypothetical protein EI94DRAFT_1698748 [Lactarius quietus]|nr:hypothetical protein EI94DRAFT_1698748 [Lactarius quietus]
MTPREDLSTLSTPQAHWEQWELAQRLWGYDLVDYTVDSHHLLGCSVARELRVSHAIQLQTPRYTASRGPINPPSGWTRTYRIVFPGAGTVQSHFARRTMRFSHDDELTTLNYHHVRIDAIYGGPIITSVKSHEHFVALDSMVRASETACDGSMLGDYAAFPPDMCTVAMRIRLSSISVEQALRNLERKIPDGTRLEQTAGMTLAECREKLSGCRLGVSQYCSGYDDKVHESASFTGNCIWVTIPYPLLAVSDVTYSGYLWCRDGQILFGPERIPGIVQSTCQDYKEVPSGDFYAERGQRRIAPYGEEYLLMQTHIIVEAALKRITGFDPELAFKAADKDATVPLADDNTTSEAPSILILIFAYIQHRYSERRDNVNYEVHAGLGKRNLLHANARKWCLSRIEQRGKRKAMTGHHSVSYHIRYPRIHLTSRGKAFVRRLNEYLDFLDFTSWNHRLRGARTRFSQINENLSGLSVACVVT